MNYIRHLNAFFSFVKADNRITTSHLSLYLALFQYWNFNRFTNPFPIYRSDILRLCKIGSKNTYHKCLKELHQYNYIIYHPAPHKYQPVKISVIRLDKQVPKDPTQLDLFNTKSGSDTGIKNDTQHVPILTNTSTDNNTGQVPKMGHLIKPNYKQERETPTQEIIKKNKKIQITKNKTEQVPKSISVTINDVNNFFRQNNYPSAEAKKFFSHYKAIGWKIQGVTPIEDWKALVEKWMTNAARWQDSKQQHPIPDGAKDIQYLYDSFLEGKKFFQSILPDHFEQLKLQLTDEIMQHAWKERINQVSGTNQHSLIELWKAYLKADPENKLLMQDQPNRELLAKQIAVLTHFQAARHAGKSHILPSD